ncbi:hypothetical protein [uncultured Algibacter sp.]|uniref:hypothetical protein n=1 Tax=uncultured Algibacter sp. TaxID=298659 RepID=UPI00261B4F34|nr:hypothetical protein [uncultured Algibacter sp.]
MEKKPAKVKLIGKEKQYYLIKFPNLKVPVKVNQNLYTKMKQSQDYVFSNSDYEVFNSHSA